MFVTSACRLSALDRREFGQLGALARAVACRDGPVRLGFAWQLTLSKGAGILVGISHICLT